MSNIIDLGLNEEFGENTSNSKCSEPIQNTKVKRVLGAMREKIEEYFKTSKVIIEKSANSNAIHAQLPNFYLVYSLFSSITWFHTEGRIVFANKLLFEEKPFTLVSKSLRLAALQLFSQTNMSLPMFTFSVNIENGEVSISSLFNTSEMAGRFDEVLNEILIKMFLTLYDQRVELIKIVKLLSKNPVPETTNSNNLEKNTKLFSKLLKYVKISFVELEGSEMELDQRKGLKTTEFAQKINLAEEEEIHFINKELLSSLLLYQNTHGSRGSLRQLELSEFEVKELNPYMTFPKAKILNSFENEYIFNDIFVENAKSINLISTNMRGGTSELFAAKVAFEYIFSSKFMFDMFNNKHAFGEKLEKVVLVKKANNKFSQKYIDHELKILENFKSTSSAYMIKYYKNEQTSPLKNKLVMDYLQGSLNLDKFVLKNKFSLSIMSKLLILSNISNGLRFLKRHKIVHMDLNPLNILMAPGFLPKIIDFGESYCERTCGPDYSPGFTNPYSAPEIFTNKCFDLKQDIFSLGIIAFKILFESFPFHPSEILKQSYKIRNYHNRLFFAPESSEYIWIEGPIYILLSLIIRCVSLNSEHRPYPIWIRIISRMMMEWYNNAFRKF